MEHFCFLVIISFFGLAMALQLSAPYNAAQAQPQPQPIYDIDGHELTGDNFYQIIPVGNLSDQCVTISSLSQYDCTARTILEPCKHHPGFISVPVSIKLAAATNASSKEASPRLSTDVVIEFGPVINMCMRRLQWCVYGDITDQMHVTAGRSMGIKGCELPRRTCKEPRFLFRVERHGTGYKLASCYKAPCRDLVLYDYNRLRWLIVEEDGRQPLLVVFKKCPAPCLPTGLLS